VVEDSWHDSGLRNQSDELSQFHRGTSLNKSCPRNQKESPLGQLLSGLFRAPNRPILPHSGHSAE
jgi:hypothetical protein